MRGTHPQAVNPWARLIGVLLRLYPGWFRREYGQQIHEAARAELQSTSSGHGAVSRWHVAGDVLVNLGRAWMSTVRSGGAERTPGRRGSRLSSGSGGLRGTGHDLRAAARGLLRRPGFALLAVLTMSVGIGLTAAMFSIVQGLALRGLPLEDAEQIVAIRRVDPDLGEGAIVASGVHLLADLTAEQTTLQGLVGWQGVVMNIADEHEPAASVPGLKVGDGFLSLLRVNPVLGRDFTRDDGAPGAAPVALISHGLWHARFGADSSIVGATIRLDGVPTQVVGVLEEGFAFPRNTDVWLPLQADAAILERGEGPPLFLVGRLREGGSEVEAQTELTLLVQRLGEAYPETDGGYRMLVKEWTADFLGSGGRQGLLTMLLAVSMVLVLACVNVANLLLVRAIAGSRELALRAALGASRARLVRQGLFDALIIAGLGAGGGVVIAHLGSLWFASAWQSLVGAMPFYVDVRVDTGVVLFVSVLAVASGLISALLPVLQVARSDSQDLLRHGARTGANPGVGRISRGLVVVQVAVACALLVGAGVFGSTVGDLRGLDLGLDLDRVFTAALTLPDSVYPEPEQRTNFYTALLARLGSQPDIDAVALTTDLPLSGRGSTRFGLAGNSYGAREAPRARLAAVSPEYFDALGLAAVRGRLLSATDTPDTVRVAVVTRSFADRHLDGNPVGARIVLAPPVDAVPETDQEIEVVGVVDELYGAVQTTSLPREAILVPLQQRPQAGLTGINLVARTSDEPLALTGIVQSELAALDPDLPLAAPTTARQAFVTNYYYLVVFGGLFGVFGLAALLLSAVGVYGVIAFATSRRTHEVGVRLALGATSRSVARLLMRQGLWRVTIGVAVGLVVGRLLASAFAGTFGVSASAPVVFVTVPVVLVLTSLLGSWLPARRAARVDPAATLSSE